MDIIRPTFVKINLSNLEYNYKLIKNSLKKSTKILSVIKANAYGHGSYEVAKKLEGLGADFFGVATIEEGIFLREKGIKSQILVLGSIYPFSSFKYIFDYKLTPTISSLYLAQKLEIYCKKNNKKIKVHLKIDTGMARIGISIKKAKETILEINKLKHIELEGIFTHIANNDSKELTEKQINMFTKLRYNLKKENIVVKYFHCANSRTAFEYQKAHFDMVRIGIGLYGLYNFSNLKDGKKLKQVMELKTKIIFLKTVPKNTPISYDGIFVSPKKMIIATVPIGYADGYVRNLSNKAEAIIKGQKVRQIGRICMDMCMFDVSNIKNVNIGDDVILAGESENVFISIEDLARKSNTITYEFATNISNRVPRVFVE